MQENLLKKIEEISRKIHKGAKRSHDFSHTERVLALAEKIARKEKANLDVVKIAALLHDIGRMEEDECFGKKMPC